ncbi:S8 family peptidase [Gracilibacillus boraciitolerans]|uniref:S8 family peptidase n=1 Tax=Gracilibacillus boraciitolerans TaxID=307521 RepID=UPI0034E22E91
MNKNHKDLSGKVVIEYNAIQPQNSAEDILNHGTAIAGIITANDNDFGITGGVSQNVEIYSVKVINDDGKIEKQVFLDGFEWAISQNVNIINISSGFSNDFPELRALIDTAVEKGIVVVAASGNTFGLNAQFPARYDNVLSISAITEQKTSPNFAANGKVDFVAPGVEVVSLDNQGGYSINDGSSYSTAYVTGIIAEYLLNNDLKQKDDISSEVRKFLEKSSLDLETSENIVGAGIPILNK